MPCDPTDLDFCSYDTRFYVLDTSGHGEFCRSHSGRWLRSPGISLPFPTCSALSTFPLPEPFIYLIFLFWDGVIRVGPSPPSYYIYVLFRIPRFTTRHRRSCYCIHFLLFRTHSFLHSLHFRWNSVLPWFLRYTGYLPPLFLPHLHSTIVHLFIVEYRHLPRDHWFPVTTTTTLFLSFRFTAFLFWFRSILVTILLLHDFTCICSRCLGPDSSGRLWIHHSFIHIHVHYTYVIPLLPPTSTLPFTTYIHAVIDTVHLIPGTLIRTFIRFILFSHSFYWKFFHCLHSIISCSTFDSLHLPFCWEFILHFVLILHFRLFFYSFTSFCSVDTIWYIGPTLFWYICSTRVHDRFILHTFDTRSFSFDFLGCGLFRWSTFHIRFHSVILHTILHFHSILIILPLFHTPWWNGGPSISTVPHIHTTRSTHWFHLTGFIFTFSIICPLILFLHGPIPAFTSFLTVHTWPPHHSMVDAFLVHIAGGFYHHSPSYTPFISFIPISF